VPIKFILIVFSTCSAKGAVRCLNSTCTCRWPH
jgi:hypothetical protein